MIRPMNDTQTIGEAVGRMLGKPSRGRPPTHSEQTLPIPNPGDWCSVDGAAALLQVSRSSVYRFAERKLLTMYYADTVPLLWRAEVTELATARARAGVGGP